MANIFGTGQVEIFYGNSRSFTMPLASRDGRTEDFIAEKVTWLDLYKKAHESIKGYRLKAQYVFRYIENDDFENLLEIYNYGGSIRLKFSTIPRHYPVVITQFSHDLADGYNYGDSLIIEFTGVNLVPKFPNPDNIYSFVPMLGRGGIVITLEEQ